MLNTARRKRLRNSVKEYIQEKRSELNSRNNYITWIPMDFRYANNSNIDQVAPCLADCAALKAGPSENYGASLDDLVLMSKYSTFKVVAISILNNAS